MKNPGILPGKIHVTYPPTMLPVITGTRYRTSLVIMCVIVGDVPNNSGYMLRFTQEHSCLRVSSKPVDMPEDSIIDVVAFFFFFDIF